MVWYTTSKENFRVLILSAMILLYLTLSYIFKTKFFDVIKKLVSNDFIAFLIFSLISVFITLIFFLYLFSNYFFKIPISIIKDQIPNFNGVWEGKGKSSYIENKKEFNVTVKIKQNFHDISADAYFERSKSKIISAFIKNESNELIYNYQNDPKKDSGLDQHRGTVILEIDKEENKLSGTYFNDREPQTKGDLELSKKT